MPVRRSETWFQNEGKMEESMTEKFKRLLDLQPNWDSYGAKPINPLALHSALDFLESVIVVPTSKGGVHLEWHKGGVDLEIEFTPEGLIVKENA